MLLEGKNAIVTGARKGIGRAIIEVFAANGANLWACARKKDEAFEADMAGLAEKYGVWIEPVYFDLSSDEEIKCGFSQIRKKKQTVDVLVNNAGMNSPYRRFQMIPAEDFKKMMQANFLGHMELAQFVSRLMMVQRSGSIINVSSIAGSDGFFASCDYVASKAAIMGATVQQARELGAFGIRVNHLSPGVTETNMLSHENDEMLQSILPAIMLKRFGRADEIANAALFLASELSSYMTGQELRVDGGCTPPRAYW